MHRFAAVACFFALVATARAAEFPTGAADNWHHWRGPNADGSAPKADPPTKWDANTNIRWKAELPGRGSSTPIVWGDRVFVLTATKTDRVARADELPQADPRFDVKTSPPTNFYKFGVVCFDRAGGKKLWRRRPPRWCRTRGTTRRTPTPAGRPPPTGRSLYASFGSFGTYCYDLDGNLKWSRTDLGRIHSRLGWGEAVTPVVYAIRCYSTTTRRPTRG